jgi:hypothetical protein
MSRVARKSVKLTFGLVLLLAACDDVTEPEPPRYTVGGLIAGLSGSVVLQNNAGNNLTVTANGSFTFAGTVNSGAGYNVTVLTQPAGQTCVVTDGMGIVTTSNITSVMVSCT